MNFSRSNAPRHSRRPRVDTDGEANWEPQLDEVPSRGRGQAGSDVARPSDGVHVRIRLRHHSLRESKTMTRGSGSDVDPRSAGGAGPVGATGLQRVLENLAYRPTPADWREYRLRRALARVTRLPGVRQAARAMSRVAARIERFHSLESGLPATVAAVDPGSRPLPTEFGSGYGYADELRELAAVVHYRSELEGMQADRASESGMVHAEILGRVSAALNKHPEIRTVTNFGVGYGHVDSVLARRFPAVRFYGFDRSALTKAFNEHAFQLPNLGFVAGDVFQHFATVRTAGPWLLLHARTLTMLPRSFVRRLYQSAGDAGAVATVAVEQCGISWQTGRPYDFSGDPEQPSVALSAGMFVHNYPGLLMEAGFDVTDAALLEPHNPDRTLRFASITAERRDP